MLSQHRSTNHNTAYLTWAFAKTIFIIPLCPYIIKLTLIIQIVILGPGELTINDDDNCLTLSVKYLPYK